MGDVPRKACWDPFLMFINRPTCVRGATQRAAIVPFGRLAVETAATLAKPRLREAGIGPLRGPR